MSITRERARQIFLGNGPEPSASEERELASMALAAMDSESGCLPLDYLQGHKDGLEWAARLAEANHPETGDWLYDDPIELAKAIRKGPDMPPAQPVECSEPVAEVYQAPNVGICAALGPSIRMLCPLEPGTKLYLHAQPVPVVPVVPDEIKHRIGGLDWGWEGEFNRGWNACRAAMLKENPVCTCPTGDGSLRWPCSVHPGNSPAISDNWKVEAEKLAEMHGMSFVLFRHGEAPQCADPTKVVISFTDKGLGHDPLPAAPQEVR
nr:DUF551 domain-containing protein [Klebsiella pneumoniae]